MADKHDNNKIDPSLMDTQRLLLGVELPEDAPFDLEDILAEFGGAQGTALIPDEMEDLVPAPEPIPEPEPEPAAEPEAAPQPEPEAQESSAPFEPEAPAEAPAEDDAALDLAFWDDFAAAEGLYLPEDFPQEPEEAPPADSPPPPPEAEAASAPEPEQPPAVSMEDVVASTVDAVKEIQEQRQEKFRKRLEKAVRKERKAARQREPVSRRPLPEVDSEPPAGETAGRNKRRFRECRRALTAAVIVLIVLWAPWVLVQAGVTVPFFSDSADNAALCVLVGQAVVSILCWPVYRAAVNGLRDGAWTVYSTALLCTVVTLLDEMTMLLLPERTDAAPLGGVAAVLSIFALWGLTGWHRGMAETFRIAAMGEPSRVAECTASGITRGMGTGEGFYTRAAMEDTAAQWQRLLLPVLATASAVFAGLSSVGQDRPQDFLWCWSAVLCASSSLVFPMAFNVPFGRIAAHLARSGAAVAGMYGASALAGGKRVSVTDVDLFPPGAASLAGIKLYGEEQNHAISYTATLAVQGGGLLGRLFGEACRRNHIEMQRLEHFHIHEEGGLGGMIHGETVLVGTPTFMRHQAVHMPSGLNSKTAVCMAVDGELMAVFNVKYSSAEPVEYALRVLRRNGFCLVPAVRDGNIVPKFLKARFGWDGGGELPEISERLTLSDPEREAEGVDGLLYRDGLLPYAFLVVDSRRLCQTTLVGNLLSIFSSIAGALLGFYLTFAGSYTVLTPLLLLTFLLLWVVPMMPLVWTVDNG